MLDFIGTAVLFEKHEDYDTSVLITYSFFQFFQRYIWPTKHIDHRIPIQKEDINLVHTLHPIRICLFFVNRKLVCLLPKLSFNSFNEISDQPFSARITLLSIKRWQYHKFQFQKPPCWKTNLNGAKVLSWTGPTEYRGPVSIFIIGQLATDRTKVETGHLC